MNPDMVSSTTLDLTSLAAQWSGWGVLLVVAIIATRAVWAKLGPHIDASLKAKLKRYETTTDLTAGLQLALRELATQQAQIVKLMEAVSYDSRIHRKAVQSIARLMEHHKCLAGVDVKEAMFDSDQCGENDDSSSDA